MFLSHAMAKRSTAPATPGGCPHTRNAPASRAARVLPSMGTRQTALQHLRQDHRVVVLAVARGVDERERRRARPMPQRCQRRTLVAELANVAAAELLEAVRNVAEPLPQLGAGSQLLLPGIKLGMGTGDSPRPQ